MNYKKSILASIAILMVMLGITFIWKTQQECLAKSEEIHEGRNDKVEIYKTCIMKSENDEVVPILSLKLDKNTKPTKIIKTLKNIFETTGTIESTEKGLEVNFQLKNISSSEMKFKFGNGQKYEITIYDENNNIINKWSENYCFITVIQEKTLQPNEVMAFSELWEKDFEAGTYRTKVDILARSCTSEEFSDDELYFEKIIKVK